MAMYNSEHGCMSELKSELKGHEQPSVASTQSISSPSAVPSASSSPSAIPSALSSPSFVSEASIDSPTVHLVPLPRTRVPAPCYMPVVTPSSTPAPAPCYTPETEAVPETVLVPRTLPVPAPHTLPGLFQEASPCRSPPVASPRHSLLVVLPGVTGLRPPPRGALSGAPEACLGGLCQVFIHAPFPSPLLPSLRYFLGARAH